MHINFPEVVLSALQNAATLANASPEQVVIDLVRKHTLKHEIAATRARLRELKGSTVEMRGRFTAVLAIFEKQPQSAFRVADIVAAIPGSNAQYNGRVLSALCDQGKIKRVGRGAYQLA